MLWVALASLSAFTVAAHDTIAKKLLNNNASPYFIAGAQFFLSSIFLAYFVFSADFPIIQSGFYSALIITVVLNVIASMIAFKAIQISDISLIAPMVSFTPVFLILTSFLILGEVPSALGIVGITLIVLGSYIVHRRKILGERWYEALTSMWRSRGSMMILGVSFIFSITSNFDKLAVLNSSPLFAAMTIDFLLGLALLVISVVLARREKGEITLTAWPWLLVMGAFFALGTWASYTALSLTLVPYAISVKRLSILFTIMAGYLFFKEQNARFRLGGAGVMLAGVALIAFS